MLEFAWSVVRSGFRSRSFQSVMVVGLFLVGVAFLAASFSPRSPKTVALDVGLSGIRFALVLFALFWVQDFVSREIDRKTIFHSLSYPVSRLEYLCGRLAGIVILLAIVVVGLGFLLQIAVLAAGGQYEQDWAPDLGVPYWTALFGLWLSVAVVTAVAFFVASLSTISGLPFVAGAAFAIASQSVGPVADYLTSGADGQKELVHRYAPIIQAIRWVLPDLSRLDWRVWPMYGVQPVAQEMMYACMLALAYFTLVFFGAVLMFRRRDFL